MAIPETSSPESPPTRARSPSESTTRWSPCPSSGYRPRRFDPRVNVIPVTVADYASPIDAPLEQRWMMRFRLEKKDPAAATSEPVHPLVYYVDNGAPEPIRQALVEGASWWNQAFEAAGFVNAFQVKVLPPDVDPMDVRYNVIHWVHRSTRGWSYGETVVDPRTGEILKGNVLLGSLARAAERAHRSRAHRHDRRGRGPCGRCRSRVRSG